MEDQQPDSGDLTAEPTESPSESAADRPEQHAPSRRRRRLFRRKGSQAPPEPEPVADAPAPEPRKAPVGKAERASKAAAEQQDADESELAAADGQLAGTDTEPDEEQSAEVTLVPHRPAGNRIVAVAVAASVLFVAATAFAGAMVQPYLVERALVRTKLDIAATAADAITTLWTYTPDDMGTLADRASRYLSGDFAQEYRRYIDAIVEPNKQAQVTNTTEVVGAAVESVSPPVIPSEATAIVYTNSVAVSPVTKNIPSLRYLSYRLTMQREGSRWLITRMSTVTSFDLTPQL